MSKTPAKRRRALRPMPWHADHATYLRSKAFHEAGHVIAVIDAIRDLDLDPKDLTCSINRDLTVAEIEAGADEGGTTSTWWVPPVDSSPTGLLTWTVKHDYETERLRPWLHASSYVVVVNFAGPMAFAKHTGCTHHTAIMNGGITDYIDAENTILAMVLALREFETDRIWTRELLHKVHWRMTRKLIARQWRSVEAVAEALLATGSLSGTDLHALVGPLWASKRRRRRPTREA